MWQCARGYLHSHRNRLLPTAPGMPLGGITADLSIHPSISAYLTVLHQTARLWSIPHVSRLLTSHLSAFELPAWLWEPWPKCRSPKTEANKRAGDCENLLRSSSSLRTRDERVGIHDPTPVFTRIPPSSRLDTCRQGVFQDLEMGGSPNPWGVPPFPPLPSPSPPFHLPSFPPPLPSP